MQLWLAKSGITGEYLIFRVETPPVWREVSNLKGVKKTCTCCGYGNDIFWIRYIEAFLPAFNIPFFGQHLIDLTYSDGAYQIRRLNNFKSENTSPKIFHLIKDKTFGMYQILNIKEFDLTSLHIGSPVFTTSKIENFFPTFKIKDSHGCRVLERTSIENGYQIREVKNEPNK